MARTFLALFLFLPTTVFAAAFPASWCGTLLHLAGQGVTEEPETLPKAYLTKPLRIRYGSEGNPRYTHVPTALVDLPDRAKLWDLVDALPSNEFLVVAVNGHLFRAGRPYRRRRVIYRGSYEVDYLVLVHGGIYRLARRGLMTNDRFDYALKPIQRQGAPQETLDGIYLELGPIAWGGGLGPELMNPFFVPFLLPFTQLRIGHAAYRFTAPDDVVARLKGRFDAAEAPCEAQGSPIVSMSATDFDGVSRVQSQWLMGGVDRVGYPLAWGAVAGIVAAALYSGR